jgi:hypothetical protein
VTKNATQDGIIVLGVPRSGTTLLRRLLNSHPNIACPGETYLLSACARFLRSDRLASGADMGVLSGLEFAGFDRSHVLEQLRNMAFEYFQEYAKSRGKSRWAEKTAIDAFYVDEIDTLCGSHAKFVCMVRHGLDVACSCDELVTKNGAIPLELHEFVKRNNVPIEAYCQAWAVATQSIIDFAERHPDNSIICRYEDLAADPDSVLSDILQFVGEPWQADLVQRALDDKSSIGIGDWKTFGTASVDSSSVGRWHSLPAAVLGRLADIANSTLERAGYDCIGAPPSDEDEDDIKRRYELALLIQSSRSQE